MTKEEIVSLIKQNYLQGVNDAINNQAPCFEGDIDDYVEWLYNEQKKKEFKLK